MRRPPRRSTHGRTADSGTAWILRTLLMGLVALVGAAGAVAATAGDDEGERVVTAIGGFATTPARRPRSRQAAAGLAGAEGVADGRGGVDGRPRLAAQDGWADVPRSPERAARAEDLQEVGVLDSSRYASLHPGYWIVFSGVYSSEAEATSALDDARAFARSATVRRVVP